MGLPIVDNIPQFSSVEELRVKLHTDGCRRCDLGFQKEINGCCVSRGNNNAKIVIVGEAPGKIEDSTGRPFTGPAGLLLDKIMRAVDLDTNRDMYLTNVVHCRPYLPKGSGKENYTPKIEQQKRCKGYLEQELALINPKVIVLLGKVAVDNVLPELKKEPMYALRGRRIIKGDTTYFIMYHPAAILHAEPTPDKQYEMKVQTWDDAQSLKKIIEELHAV